VNHEGFEQRPASRIRAETSQDKPADEEKPCKRRQPAEHPANGRKRNENRAEKQKAAETGARQADQHTGQDHPRGNEHIYKVGHSEKAVTMKCPALPSACADDHSRDQQTTESDDGMASENAGEDYCGDNENPYDGRHSVQSFLLQRGWKGQLCLRCYLPFPDMIVPEVTDGSDADG